MKQFTVARFRFARSLARISDFPKIHRVSNPNNTHTQTNTNIYIHTCPQYMEFYIWILKFHAFVSNLVPFQLSHPPILKLLQDRNDLFYLQLKIFERCVLCMLMSKQRRWYCWILYMWPSRVLLTVCMYWLFKQVEGVLYIRTVADTIAADVAAAGSCYK